MRFFLFFTSRRKEQTIRKREREKMNPISSNLKRPREAHELDTRKKKKMIHTKMIRETNNAPMPKMTPHALSLAVLREVATKTSSRSSFPRLRAFASTMMVCCSFRRQKLCTKRVKGGKEKRDLFGVQRALFSIRV